MVSRSGAKWTSRTASTSGEEVEEEERPLLTRASDEHRNADGRRCRGSSSGLAVFNLTHAIMGSGILGLAYAMAQTGIVLFSLLLVLVASLAAYSIHLLLKLCQQSGVNSYEDLGTLALGRKGKIMAAGAIILQNIGAMSSYLFIIKSEMPKVIRGFLNYEPAANAWYMHGTYLLLLLALLVVLPLAFLPKIGFLGYVSCFSVFFMLFFTSCGKSHRNIPHSTSFPPSHPLSSSAAPIIPPPPTCLQVIIKKFSVPCPLPPTNVTLGYYTLYNSNSSNSSDACSPKLFTLSLQSAYAIPTMAFSFLCHTSVLPIYCELQRPSTGKMQKVANTSISLAFIIYYLSAIFGYLTFYSSVSPELLEMYGLLTRHDSLVMSVRLCILMSVLLTVPLIHFPARKAVLKLVADGRPFSWLHHTLATLALITLVLILAIFVPNIKEVFGFVGATTSTCLLFIFPALFYIIVSREPLLSPQKMGALSLLVFGVAVCLMSITLIILGWARQHPHTNTHSWLHRGLV
ncbi:LOW QUALITY PROTEIN: probable sodium-coupled neutral amino acid transporter 6 [Lethenteron reissneri]|uniref:LOW QUALITY PROTEIN: probable sodium-coupled neutral amino acid transporter 6 n=1 Tax=Lethenteron reissneri TaxID=7753 RepID=UPI002AB7A11D|nr:LOW QUALITY PROTEIN: probable sodium-coupled neutral amino acid transporter 6 [Lethenteron reissneri]